MNKNAALLYRETIVQTATPVGLITLLHEEAIRSLNQALHGLREKNLEKRTLALSHVIQITGYLQSILDFERGGNVAQQLSDFYNMVRAKVIEASIKSSEEIVQQLVEEFRLSAEAWRQVDQTVSSGQTQQAPIRSSHNIPNAPGVSSAESLGEPWPVR